jgi:hypothetical protein
MWVSRGSESSFLGKRAIWSVDPWLVRADRAIASFPGPPRLVRAAFLKRPDVVDHVAGAVSRSAGVRPPDAGGGYEQLEFTRAPGGEWVRAMGFGWERGRFT